MVSLVQQLRSKPNTPHFVFTQYLFDLEHEIIELINNSSSFNLIAPTSAGKTFGLIKIAHENKIKIVLAVPLNMIAKQKQKEFKDKHKIVIGCVAGDVRDSQGRTLEQRTSDKEIQDCFANEDIHVIATTYDSIDRIAKSNKELLSNYVLVIDEVHNLTTQYGFRYKGIKELLKNIGHYKKCISLTATPEGSFLYNVATYWISKNVPATAPTITLVEYGEQLLQKIFLHIKSNPQNGLTIIYIDSKYDLYFLSKAIENELGLFCRVLTSDNKGSDIHLQIQDKEEVPEYVKFLLTTRLLSDGVNLYNKKVDAFYIAKSTDFLLKRQFIKRFRNGVKNIYEFVKYDSKEPGNFNIERRYSDLREIDYSVKNQSNPFDVNAIKNVLRKEFGQLKYIPENISDNNHLLRYGLLERVHHSINRNKQLIEEYYKDIAEFNVRSENPVYSKDDLTETKRIFDKLAKDILRNEDNRKWVIKNRHALIEYYLLSDKNERDGLIKRSPWISSIMAAENDSIANTEEFMFMEYAGISTYFKKVATLLKLGCFEELTGEILFKSLEMQDHKFISDFYDRLIYRIEFELVKNFEHINKDLLFAFISDYDIYKKFMEEFPIDEFSGIQAVLDGVPIKNTDKVIDKKELNAWLQSLSDVRGKAQTMFYSIYYTKDVPSKSRRKVPAKQICRYITLTDLAVETGLNLERMHPQWDKGLYVYSCWWAITRLNEALYATKHPVQEDVHEFGQEAIDQEMSMINKLISDLEYRISSHLR